MNSRCIGILMVSMVLTAAGQTENMRYECTFGKPKVWVISDGADKRLERAPGKQITDPDDMSALAGYCGREIHGLETDRG